ncbi:PQQ-dependent sugar dehydrogenase [Haloglycomyces albus]|uniref:PQQ-dependent sugar dehydrogenase n=1 Tax=Haloglycomyces albus TaxID=526067 RepID=UPI00046D52A3|nr:PQQ-dependent sugar dehydrogenase [Haloglycomyces albus]
MNIAPPQQTRRQRSGLLVTALAVTMFTACTSEPDNEENATPSPEPTPSTTPQERTEVVSDNLDVPWSIAFYNETLLVSERDSTRILELDDEGEARSIGTIDAAVPNGEGGLLGLAVADGYLFTYFTADDENRIERRELSGEPGSLEFGASETVVDGIPAAGHHNGGRIAIGPDGMLYVTTGDAGNTGNAQDLDSLAGKILRMTPSGGVPDDNPFADSLVFSFGHRNPQGIAWADDGTLYSSEFGQDTWDELNVIEAGGNYGWPEVEGVADRDGFIDPVQQWRPAEASPSGIEVYEGAVYIANLRGERLFEVPLSDPTTVTEHFVGDYGRIRDVIVGNDGSLWMVTNNTDGRGDPSDTDDRIIRVNLEE